MLADRIHEAIGKNRLPESFFHIVETYYVPLAKQVERQVQKTSRHPLVFAIQGSQGSGKSTCAFFLKLLLEEMYGLSCAVLSIDDFYLTRSSRAHLAKDVHPLLQTRGVPGTHDVALAMDVFHRLRTQKASQEIALPRFDKARDERLEHSDWPRVLMPVDIIIFEGWCVALTPQKAEDLLVPINELERLEDAQGVWRHYVNEQLKGSYQTWFEEIDCLAVLRAPSFECVYEWRLLQEEKLREKLSHEAGQEGKKSGSVKIMDQREIQRFISHYERLTRHGLDSLPKRADWILQLAENHNITSLVTKK